MTTARQHHNRTNHRRLLASAAAVVAVTALTAACTGESKDNKAAAPSTSPSSAAPIPSAAPSVSADPEAADKAEVQTAYTRYWDVLTAAYSTADPDHAELSKVATGTALVRTQQGLKSLRKAEQVVVGQPTHSNTNIAFKPDAKLKTAIISECLDISQWKPVEKNTSKEVQLPNTRLLRYVTTVTAEKWPNGWMVLEEKQEGKAC
ncbi:hypothetical protein [Streptomyces sp. NPDC001568]|uniref:hypothetical protein n=1 Tax=Streptomyces sp. NPDC001568 TaxID=3364588 RepID=UPI0036CE4FED